MADLRKIPGGSGAGGAKMGEGQAAYFQSEASALLMLSFTANTFVLQGGDIEITWEKLEKREF